MNFGDVGDIVRSISMGRWFGDLFSLFHVSFTTWVMVFAGLSLAVRLARDLMRTFHINVRDDVSNEEVD